MSLVVPKEVYLQSVDCERLEGVEDVPEAVVFSVMLSDVPTSEWHLEFDHAYLIMHHPIKPPVRVEDDRLWITYLPRYDKELPDYIEFLKRVVERANAEEIRTAHLRDRDRGGHKAKFREVLKSLSLETRCK